MRLIQETHQARRPTAAEQETILIAEDWNKIMWEIVSYVLKRDGRVDPNDNEWMLLVGRAKALVEAVASAAGLLPDRLLRPGQGDV